MSIVPKFAIILAIATLWTNLLPTLQLGLMIRIHVLHDHILYIHPFPRKHQAKVVLLLTVRSVIYINTLLLLGISILLCSKSVFVLFSICLSFLWCFSGSLIFRHLNTKSRSRAWWWKHSTFKTTPYLQVNQKVEKATQYSKRKERSALTLSVLLNDAKCSFFPSSYNCFTLKLWKLSKS